MADAWNLCGQWYNLNDAATGYCVRSELKVRGLFRSGVGFQEWEKGYIYIYISICKGESEEGKFTNYAREYLPAEEA